jgi:hypothetical protein
METALNRAIKEEEIGMKDHEKKELERLEKKRTVIEKSPLAKQIIAEETAAILAMRAEAAAKIEVVKTGRDTVIPKLQADLDAQEATYKKAKDDLDAAGSEFQAAKGALSIESQFFDTEIRNQEQVLIESADPLLDEAIQFFRDRREALFHKSINRDVHKGESNIFTMTKKLTIF